MPTLTPSGYATNVRSNSVVTCILLCISLIIMVTVTRHVFTNIYQMQHLSTVKFDMGKEKNMSFLAIPKSPKSLKIVEKKKKKNWIPLNI